MHRLEHHTAYAVVGFVWKEQRVSFALWCRMYFVSSVAMPAVAPPTQRGKGHT